MKKYALILALCALLGGPLFAGGQQGSSGAETGKPWEPSRNVDWIVTSSAGGGSDIFTRVISDIMVKEGFSKATIMVTNKTDGGGEVGRAQVANTSSALADHTLLTFNSGDLMPMVKNTPNRIAMFKPIGVLAVDKQLIFINKTSAYKTFQAVIDAVKGGKKVVMGGSKGDDIATYNLLLSEMKWTETQLPYITYDSTNDALTAILGNHVDIVISKPAASAGYVEAGDLLPILALSTERYTGNLSGAPILSELGYKNVEIPVWRGVVGPAAMSAQAQAYWSDILKKVSETQTWKKDYLEKFKLMSDYKTFEEATAYMTKYQADYMAANGIK
ncbi:MAG: tripartite tricarboxylate transporter substrate binding protein [Spirochaetales bacterium]|jgi:putative tricarboxylic transport membrane protein|nr:tripartite tricarboxylate transporter substrate binding protein [Spirochaetales bacterium]